MDDQRFTDVCVLDNNAINDPMFDLIPGKHGHFLDKDGKTQKVNRARMIVPFLDINSKTLFQLAAFVDEMEGTCTHPEVTIITKEANKEHGIPAKIGIFAI
jgi:hypothetical protein